MRPQVLLLDEPTSHLDPQATREILAVLRRLNKTLGITILIAAHYIDEIASLSDRVWLMDAGRLVLDLPTDQAFEDLRPYRRLGVQAPQLAQVAEQLGYAERPLTVEHAASVFDRNQVTRYAKERTHLSTDGRPSTDRSLHHVVRAGCVHDSPLLAVRDLTFRYPGVATDALKNISFEARRGEVVAIMGANGSGKTTLLLHLVALLRPSDGSVLIRGRNMRRFKSHHLAGRIGIVFQNPDLLLQATTVSDEIAFGPKNLKRTATEIEEGLEEILTTFDLHDLRDEAPYALSRGQRQRTAVAATFSLYPDLLLLDEPTTGQDANHLHTLMRMLRNVVKTENRALIFSTHNTALTLSYADRVLLLQSGELVFDGPTDAAFSSPEYLERASVIPPPLIQLQWELEQQEAKA